MNTGEMNRDKMNIFDTHTHYNHPDFRKDLSEVTDRIRAAGVVRDAVIGYDLASSLRAVELAEQDSGRVAVVGIHPLHADQAGESDLAELERLVTDPARNRRIAAVGETGLDYHRKEPEVTPEKELQKRIFREQLRLARRAGLPVVIHSRDAAQDTYDILAEEKAGERGGVIHCYSGSPDMAGLYVKMGFFLGIGGKVTYAASKRLRETVKRIPLEKLVLETDCPYLSPEDRKGTRNDSCSLHQVAGVVAELKGIPVEEAFRITWENALKLYRMPEE